MDSRSLSEDSAQVTPPAHESMDRFVELMKRVDGVRLSQLEPLTTLLVWTWNALYEVIVAEGSNVLLQGGAFPELTPAHIDGASMGGSLVITGWIGAGLLVEFRVSGKRIVTAPVIAIAAERPDVSMAGERLQRPGQSRDIRPRVEVMEDV
jgi:hypothetical protein